MTQVTVIIDTQPAGSVASPLGLKGVVGEGDTDAAALTDVKSAMACHLDTVGADVLEEASSILEVFGAEAGMAPPCPTFPEMCLERG